MIYFHTAAILKISPELADRADYAQLAIYSAYQHSGFVFLVWLCPSLEIDEYDFE